jgi:transcriptional regulator with XRE-family HTH domain
MKSNLDDRDKLGRLLTELRQIRGWTQAEVAERADVPVSTVGIYERGDSRRTIDRLHKLASAYDATASELLDDAGL